MTKVHHATIDCVRSLFRFRAAFIINDAPPSSRPQGPMPNTRSSSERQPEELWRGHGQAINIAGHSPLVGEVHAVLKLHRFDISNNFRRLCFVHATFFLEAPSPQLAAPITPVFANACLAW